MNDFLKNVRMREFEFHEWLDHKLKQVRLEEREECAKVCEEEHDQSKFGVNGMHCAAAIRARSKHG